MTEKDTQLLAKFELKMRRLMFLCDSLKEENVSLKKEIETKNEGIVRLSDELEQLKVKYDSLVFVKSFENENSEEMIKAKKRLSKLVRDIDKCIALLRS